MKDAKDFNVRQFVPEGSTNGTTVADGDVRPSKRSVSSEQSELTERNRIAGQTVLTSQGEHVEEIAPTPSNEQTVKPRRTVQTLANEQSVSSQRSAPAQSIEPPQPSQQRISTRQRRASLDEYRETFLAIPKIADRQPVFVSRDIRDKIDGVVRRLGERRMSVSGFLENLARHHLDLYADDLEQWRRL